MNDFNKVNSMQLYNLWKNLTVGLVTVIAMMTFSKLLPFLFLTCDSHYRCGISLCLSFWDKDVVGVIMYDHPLRNDV